MVCSSLSSYDITKEQYRRILLFVNFSKCCTFHFCCWMVFFHSSDANRAEPCRQLPQAVERHWRRVFFHYTKQQGKNVYYDDISEALSSQTTERKCFCLYCPKPRSRGDTQTFNLHVQTEYWKYCYLSNYWTCATSVINMQSFITPSR